MMSKSDSEQATGGVAATGSVRLHTAVLVVVVLPKELPPKNGL